MTPAPRLHAVPPKPPSPTVASGIRGGSVGTATTLWASSAGLMARTSTCPPRSRVGDRGVPAVSSVHCTAGTASCPRRAVSPRPGGAGWGWPWGCPPPRCPPAAPRRAARLCRCRSATPCLPGKVPLGFGCTLQQLRDRGINCLYCEHLQGHLKARAREAAAPSGPCHPPKGRVPSRDWSPDPEPLALSILPARGP